MLLLIDLQGVRYEKYYEGAMYQEQAPDSPGDSVSPGSTFIYTWTVPEDTGPGPSDDNCVPFIYHSGVNTIKDVWTGLIGPLLVCRPNTLAPTGKSAQNIIFYVCIQHQYIHRSNICF